MHSKKEILFSSLQYFLYLLIFLIKPLPNTSPDVLPYDLVVTAQRTVDTEFLQTHCWLHFELRS
jgi:hypothetical protein